MDKKIKKELTEKEKEEYWNKKRHIMNSEEHEEFMKKTGKTQEEHDKWHKTFGGGHN